MYRITLAVTSATFLQN